MTGQETRIAIGPIEHLQDDWAIIPFIGEKAHYWEEIKPKGMTDIDESGRKRYYRSLCGTFGTTDSKRPAIDPGNWPKCKTCHASYANKGKANG